MTTVDDGVTRLVPKLPYGTPPVEATAQLKRMMDSLPARFGIERLELWYDTPGALPWTRHLRPELVVYDVMDELQQTAPELVSLERELFPLADVVFVNGESLYRAKQPLHPDVHAFPSSVDVHHFARARVHSAPEPHDQAALRRPRLGFFGIIDTRIDLPLVAKLADLEPEWQLVMVGPLVKVGGDELPQRPNLHWLGAKKYSELPDYLAGWDVGLMPFALNESTRLISPTKTAELLAAGRPVVSSAVTDVVKPYGDLELVRIADGAEGFRDAVKAALTEDRHARQARADAFLAAMSWDTTWQRMCTVSDEARERRRSAMKSRAA